MAKSKKLAPQSWESAYGWLSQFVAQDGRPLLGAIQIKDGRAYACDTHVLASAACPMPVPSGCLISPLRGGTRAATLDVSAYPDLAPVLNKPYRSQIMVSTTDLVDALKKIDALDAQDGRALAVYHRKTGLLWLFADNERGAAVSLPIGANDVSAPRLYDEIGGAVWFVLDQWKRIIKGWAGGKHSWPDSAGCPNTILEFGKPWKDNDFGSEYMRLSPQFLKGPLRFDRPSAVNMGAWGLYGKQSAEEALELAQSANSRHDYRADPSIYKPHLPVKRWVQWGQTYPDSVKDLPLFEGVTAFKLGQPGPDVDPAQIWAERRARQARVDHFNRMRNHPAMIPYAGNYVASGDAVEPFIKAIKESQHE